MKIIASLSVIILIKAYLSTAEILKTKPKVPFLRSFEGFKYDTERGPDGVYRFRFHVGDSSRTEERDDSGLVKGEYAFVAPEGDEYEFKYEADKEGYRVDSNALPVKPEETEEVKKAKELFFKEYQKALERAQKSGEEEDEEESEEESGEESSEEDDEEEESYSIFAKYGFGNNGNKDVAGGESSEESSEEGDEEFEAEADEEEESKGKSELKKETKTAKKVDALAYSHFGLRTKPLPYNRRA